MTEALNELFEGVCTVQDGDKIRVVTPFAHNDGGRSAESLRSLSAS